MRQLIVLVLLVITMAMSGTVAYAAPCCDGDCDSDGVVTVNEIITLIDLALGTQTQLSACPNICPCFGDLCTDLSIIVQAIDNALTACPQ